MTVILGNVDTEASSEAKTAAQNDGEYQLRSQNSR